MGRMDGSHKEREGHGECGKSTQKSGELRRDGALLFLHHRNEVREGRDFFAELGGKTTDVAFGDNQTDAQGFHFAELVGGQARLDGEEVFDVRAVGLCGHLLPAVFAGCFRPQGGRKIFPIVGKLGVCR